MRDRRLASRDHHFDHFIGTVDEAELIARVQAGDASAEREFYDRHVDRVYRLIHRMCRRDDLAQEWTQDTFVRAFERCGQFRGDSALSTWLHSIAVSITLNGLRSQVRRDQRNTSLDDLTTEAARREMTDPDLRERMRIAIDALPTGYRTVFVMHDVEGYTHEEIGQFLGVAIGTSKAQLSRAREKLRHALAPFASRESA
jgi:RNA polymerase sigma-70 factor (ECF subfamily)